MDIGSPERVWRRSWMRAIGGLSAGARVAALPDWDARPYSVLYMRTQGIGNVILATGVLRAIAQSHHTIALNVLAAPKAVPVLAHNPYVRQVITSDGSVREAISLAATLRRASYDVIVDGKITRGASFVRSPALAMLARAPFRIGVGGGNHHLVFNILRASLRSPDHAHGDGECRACRSVWRECGEHGLSAGDLPQRR